MNRPQLPDVQELSEELAFYVSPPHPCSYLAEREAITLFADPHAKMTTALYSDLAELGFRRSGEHVYRPRCPDCTACLPVRVDVMAFKPNRSQRRNWNQNHELTVIPRPAIFCDEHYQLYRRYIHSRHPDGAMDVDSPEQYTEFLTAAWCESRFVEFRDDEQLLAVAVMDILRNGLSAVYTFFDPEASNRGLGNLAVLWLIEEAKRRQLPWIYLGYLIEQSPKMAYKANYRPLQHFDHGYWYPL